MDRHLHQTAHINVGRHQFFLQLRSSLNDLLTDRLAGHVEAITIILIHMRHGLPESEVLLPGDLVGLLLGPDVLQLIGVHVGSMVVAVPCHQVFNLRNGGNAMGLQAQSIELIHHTSPL